MGKRDDNRNDVSYLGDDQGEYDHEWNQHDEEKQKFPILGIMMSLEFQAFRPSESTFNPF